MIRKSLRMRPASLCAYVLMSAIAICASLCMQTQAQQTSSAGKIVKNVRDAGAKGDGYTDDSSAWQTAVNDGDVFCPPGVYLVGTTIAVPSERHIWGSRDCKLKTRDRTDIPVFTLTDVRDVFIEGISIDGNKAAQKDNGVGFGVFCEGCSTTKIIGLRIANTPVESIIVSKNERSSAIPEDVVIVDNISVDSSRRGMFRQHYAVTSGRRILISGNSGSSADGHAAYLVDIEPNNSGNPIEDVSVIGNHGTGVSGIAVANTATNGRIVKRINITGNNVRGPGAGAGNCFQVSYADYVSVGSNTVEGCGTNGVNVSGSNNVSVTGNHVTDFGKTGTVGETNGVKIEARSESVLVESNVFQANGPSFGIRETDSSGITVGVNDYIGAAMTPLAITSFRSSSQTSLTGKHLSVTGTVDFPVLNGDVCEEKSIRAPAAPESSTVLLALPPTLASIPGLAFNAFVSTPGAVTVKACKLTAGPTIDPPAAIVRVDVWINQ